MRRITYRLLAAIITTGIIFPIYTKAQKVISIAGNWQFAIDPADQGIQQKMV